MKKGIGITAIICSFLFVNNQAFSKPEYNLQKPAVSDVKPDGWIKNRIQRAAIRMEQLPGLPGFYNSLEDGGDWGADYSSRWLEATCLVEKDVSTCNFDIDGVLKRLLSFQQPAGNFKGNFPGAMEKELSFWGDHRALIALAILAKEENNQLALDAGLKLADFYVSVTETRDWIKLNGIPGGMASAIEGMVAFYQLTGQKKYLQSSRIMADYTIPNLSKVPAHSHSILTTARGIADLYMVTGEKKYLQACKDIQQDVKQHEYTSGGIPETFPDDGDGDETCSTADWFRFNLQLWQITQDTKYLDAAELVLFNHLIYAQLGNGGFAGFRNITDSVGDEWDFCCTHHGFLALLRTLENIYYIEENKSDKSVVHVNLFINSELKVSLSDEKYFKIKQETTYPSNGLVNFTVSTENPVNFDLMIHLTSNVQQQIGKLDIKINGKQSKLKLLKSKTIVVKQPNGGWKNDDVIQVNFPIAVYTKTKKQSEKNTTEISFWHGPLLLASTSAQSKDLPFQIISAVQDFRHYEFDKSVLGTPLKIGEKQYDYGIGVHANSKVDLSLQSNCLGFKADIGVDNNNDTQGKHGSAIFVAKIDDKEVYRSDILRGGMEPVSVDFEFTPSSNLSLIVEDAGDGIGFDQTNWANAKIILDDGKEVLISTEVKRQRSAARVASESIKSPEKYLKLSNNDNNDFGFEYELTAEMPTAKATLVLEPLSNADPSKSFFNVWFGAK